MGISFLLRESFAKGKVWRGKVESDVENVKKIIVETTKM